MADLGGKKPREVLLFVLPSRNRGGAEEYALTMAAAAKEKRKEVHVAFPRCPGTESLARDFSAAGLIRHELNIKEYPRWEWNPFVALFFDLLNLRRTLALLRKLKPDAVHITLPWPTFCFGSQLACAVARIPFLTVFQLVPPDFDRSLVRRVFYRWALRRGSEWVAISEDNRRLISRSMGVDPSEIHRIYNGSKIPAQPGDMAKEEPRRALRRELGLAENARILLTVGRLADQKGYPVLVPSIREVAKSYPETVFVWVGEGERRAVLEALLDQHGAREHVVMTGYRPDVGTLMRGSDLFVFPTLYEGGQSFVIIEAMAAGLPIVTSDASGIPEVITHEEHGLVFRTGDSKGLERALLRAMADPAEMSAMAERARKRCQDFSEERMVRETLNLLIGDHR